MTLQTSSDTDHTAIARFQNNIQSIFSRVRVLYGSTPLEDIPGYNVIVRGLTEWTSTSQNNTTNQMSIAEGIGGFIPGSFPGTTGTGALPQVSTVVNVRQSMVQGVAPRQVLVNNPDGFYSSGPVPNQQAGQSGFETNTSANYSTRRYQVNLASGLFTQDKLIPTKWMASQLAVELTLAPETSCIFTPVVTTTPTFTTTYAVTNVNLIPEILEFDASYDELFLQGLRDGGVPLKFSSWHQYTFGVSGNNMNLLIQERSRSVKAIFAVQRRSPEQLYTDSGALIYESAPTGAINVTKNQGNPGGTGTLNSFQFRIGGRYFPASPVQCTSAYGTGVSNGAAEAFVELQKCLNCVGDYRLSSSVNSLTWGLPAGLMDNSTGGPGVAGKVMIGEQDYNPCFLLYNAGGIPAADANANPMFCGSNAVGSSAFAMSTSLETSNGIEISGLNAEEQSDISLIVNYGGPQTAGFAIEVYVLYDAMLVLRENNVLELIQ